MESIRLLLQTYLRAAWRRRWPGVGIAWLICGLGWVGVYLVPNQFESSARLYVDSDAILTPLLRGLAAELGADQPARGAAAHPAQPAQSREADLEDRP